MEKVPVPAQAGRLVNAVASIGYDPEVALCDLMDNCIDAGATQIRVHLNEHINEIEGETDTVGRYLIADDGCGMDRKAVINAFTLGSVRSYPSGSLGKFGLGLKSAGLSLGSKISIITKREDGELICAILSVADIESSGEYRIELGVPPLELINCWQEHVPNESHGTLLIIEELTDSQPPFNAFVKYFKRYCSIIYHMFLEDTERPLGISINTNTLVPIDPLFLAEAENNGPLQDPQEWDGKTPKILLTSTQLALNNEISCQVAASHLIHPPSFEQEGRRDEVREKYLIESDPYTARPRHGFYVYRNRRIIVAAERFHGLISSQTQAWAFRARLMFDERADDILALDVKKRHMRLPKSARNNLKNQIANYQSKSVEAWKRAGKKVEEWKKEAKDKIANESIENTPVGDLNYAPGTDLSSDETMEKRKELQQKISADTLQSIQDGSFTSEELTKRAREGAAVLPVAGLKANAMWLPYPAVDLGRAETLINKNHSWIAEAYAAAEEDPRIALILYQLLMILSRAELEVRATDWPGVPTTTVEKILDRFRRRVSTIGEDLAESLAVELEKIRSNHSEF